MKRKAPETNFELMRNLAEAFDATPPEGATEAAEELRAWGLVPAGVGKQLAAAAREALKVSPMDWRVRAAQERARALSLLGAVQPVLKPRSELEAEIQAVLARGSEQAQREIRAYFHKHQGRASDDDLASLLAQVRFLESADGEER